MVTSRTWPRRARLSSTSCGFAVQRRSAWISLAFGAESREAVDTLAAKLGSAGVQLVGEPGELQTAGSGYGFRFFDGDGRTVEISTDVETRQHRVIEEGEAIPVRLSHFVVNKQ
ncbi:hypothetical protein [Nostocoides sp. HKS02]|uniref:hypothetical protein n=1 Tax=Nostocoides sp. HKS02 TaxID=1813880 RepID=UPI001E3EE9E4|nr:hypothetical protein [Tetrasphaera sp. HKS02]